MPEQLAVLGGTPVGTGDWPAWPVLRPAARRALLGAFDSGRWTISAPEGGDLEPSLGRAFAQYCGANVAVATANGSAALTVALAAAGVGAGDEVLVPAISWVACAAAVVSLGAVPVPVDVERDNLCMSPSAAEAACGPRTTAVLLVHQNCWIADVEAFTDFARKRGLALVEDGSHAHGARRRGRRVGTFGLAAGFSLQQSKLLACGEGGIAVACDSETGRRLQHLRANGREYDASNRNLIDGHGAMGDNYVLGEMPAAVAMANLAHLDEENRIRHAAAEHLSAGMAEIEGVRPPVHPDGDEPGYHKYTVALDLPSFAGISIPVLAAAVSAEIGTRCEVLDAPLGHNPLYAPRTSPRFKGRSEEVPTAADVHPVASAAAESSLAFRHHLLLASSAQLDVLVEAVAKVQRNAYALARQSSGVRLDVA